MSFSFFYYNTLNFVHTVAIVVLSSMTYDATEGPNAVVSVCAKVEVGKVARDSILYITTPIPGTANTGIIIIVFFIICDL